MSSHAHKVPLTCPPSLNRCAKDASNLLLNSRGHGVLCEHHIWLDVAATALSASAAEQHAGRQSSSQSVFKAIVGMDVLPNSHMLMSACGRLYPYGSKAFWTSRSSSSNIYPASVLIAALGLKNATGNGSGHVNMASTADKLWSAMLHCMSCKPWLDTAQKPSSRLLIAAKDFTTEGLT